MKHLPGAAEDAVKANGARVAQVFFQESALPYSSVYQLNPSLRWRVGK